MKTTIENTHNTVFMFSKKCFCFINLVFSVFFKTKKKLGTKCIIPIFLVLLVFENENNFQKQEPKGMFGSTFENHS